MKKSLILLLCTLMGVSASAQSESKLQDLQSVPEESNFVEAQTILADEAPVADVDFLKEFSLAAPMPAYSGYDSKYHTGSYEWKKYKRKKRWAWTCAVGGPVVMLYGLIVLVDGGVDGLVDNPKKLTTKEKVGACMIVGGGLMTIGSIPLFIRSHKFKERAKRDYTLNFGVERFNTQALCVSNRSNMGLNIGLSF